MASTQRVLLTDINMVMDMGTVMAMGADIIMILLMRANSKKNSEIHGNHKYTY